MGPVIVTLPDQDLLDGLLDGPTTPPPGVDLRYWDVAAPPSQVLGDDAAQVRAVVRRAGSAPFPDEVTGNAIDAVPAHVGGLRTVRSVRVPGAGRERHLRRPR